MKKKENIEINQIVDSVEELEAKMKKMREAQKVFATYTQDQVDKIFYEKRNSQNHRSGSYRNHGPCSLCRLRKGRGLIRQR